MENVKKIFKSYLKENLMNFIKCLIKRKFGEHLA